MNIRTLLAFALLPAVLTGCSGTDDGTPVTTDSANVETSPDTAIEDTSSPDTMTDDTFDAGSDTAEEDTSIEPDAEGETGDAADTAPSETATDAISSSCVSGKIETESCGKCGSRSRLCKMGAWLAWGACLGEGGGCTPGETRNIGCERCGTRKETCTATCEWTSGACLDQKGCNAGSSETRSGLCLDSTKTQTRTCSEMCTWSPWSDC